MDNGTEFKADVLKLMKEHDVKVISVTTKYHHNFTAFVERFNKTLGERLFKSSRCSGAAESHERLSKIWVKYLQKAVTRLNSEKTRMLGMTPSKGGKVQQCRVENQSLSEGRSSTSRRPLSDICTNRENWRKVSKDEPLT